MSAALAYLRSRVTQKSQDYIDTFIRDSMLGQKTTSKYKPLVFLNNGLVLKGPYDLSKRSALLAHTLFRWELFSTLWAEGYEVVDYMRLVCGDNPTLVYFEMPHIGSTCMSTWTGTHQTILGRDEQLVVADKRGQGIVEFGDYLDGEPHMDVVVNALIHFMHRYICDPIVGDAALRNVLVRTGDAPLAFGIDYEENRSGTAAKQDAVESGNLFDMIVGGKMWRHRSFLALVVVAKRNIILSHLSDTVAVSWPRVTELITKHGLDAAVSVANMKRRHAALTRAVETATADSASPKRKNESTTASAKKKK